MSRVGKMPVTVPAGVDVSIKEDQISVKGAGGQLAVAANALVKVNNEGGKNNDRCNRANAYDEAKLFGYHSENKVRIGRHYFMQPAVARTQSEKPARGGGGKRPRLLKALAVYVLPDMSPGCKALGYVRSYAQGEKARKSRARNRENHRCDISASHKRDNQKGSEKHESRAEIAHYRKGSDTNRRKGDV